MMQRHNVNTTGKNVYGVAAFKDLSNKQLMHYVSHYVQRHVPQTTRVHIHHKPDNCLTFKNKSRIGLLSMYVTSRGAIPSVTQSSTSRLKMCRLK